MEELTARFSGAPLGARPAPLPPPQLVSALPGRGRTWSVGLGMVDASDAAGDSGGSPSRVMASGTGPRCSAPR